MVKQTEEEFILHLEEQIGFLTRRAMEYDKGIESEAKQMTNVLRALLYDKGRTVSLLTHLNKKDILFYDTTNDLDPKNILGQSTLTCMEMIIGEGAMCKYSPYLESSPIKDNKVPFDIWWNKKVIKDMQGNIFSRKDLVLSVVHKDGGTHIDAELNPEYNDLTRNNSLGVTYELENSSGDIPGIELASVRQITYEVLKTLNDEFPELFREYNLNKTSNQRIYKIPKKNIHHECENDNELSVNCLRKYLNESQTVEYWINIIKSLGVEIGPMGMNMIPRDIEMLKLTDINTIEDLNKLLENSKGWGEKFLDEMYNNIWGEGVSKGCSTDRHGIITYFLIANYPDIFTNKVLDEDFGYGLPQRTTEPAKKYNPKYQNN